MREREGERDTERQTDRERETVSVRGDRTIIDLTYKLYHIILVL
jgi:hypothetical protein